MKFHIETIICPECCCVQKAKVEHSGIWLTYIHECKNCHYLIMESDWTQFDDHAVRQVNMVFRLLQITKGKQWHNDWIMGETPWWRPIKRRRWSKKWREPRYKFENNHARRRYDDDLPF